MLKNHNLSSPDDARRISNSTKTENIETMRLGQELDAEDEAEPVQEEVVGVAGLVGRMIKQFSPSPNDSTNNNNSVKVSRLRKDYPSTSSPATSSPSLVNGLQTRHSPLNLNVNGHHSQRQSPSGTPKQSPSSLMAPGSISVSPSSNNGRTIPSIDNQQKVSLNPLTVKIYSPQPSVQRSLGSNPLSPTSRLSNIPNRQSDVTVVPSRIDVQNTADTNNRQSKANGITNNAGLKISQGQSVQQKENVSARKTPNTGSSDQLDGRVTVNTKNANENKASVIQNKGPVLNGGMTGKNASKIPNGFPNGSAVQIVNFDHAIVNSSNGGLSPLPRIDSLSSSATCPNIDGPSVTPTSSLVPQSNGGLLHGLHSAGDHMDSSTPDSFEKDGNHYLRLIEIEANRLNGLMSVAEQDLTATLPEEASGRVRATVGKATLLTTKKFHQFQDLCHKNLTPCEEDAFQTTSGDLAGFWDLILIQVDDVNRMFAEIDTLRANNWDESKISAVNESTSLTTPTVAKFKHSELVSVASPGGKSVSNGSHKLPAKSTAGPSPTSKAQEEARRRLMAAKRAGRQRKASNEDEEIQIFAR